MFSWLVSNSTMGFGGVGCFFYGCLGLLRIIKGFVIVFTKCLSNIQIMRPCLVAV